MDSTSEGSGLKIFLTVVWGISVIAAGFIGYGYAHMQDSDKNVLQANTLITPSPSPQVTPNVADYTASTNNSISPTTAVNTTNCPKTGFAQKWEYLTAYEVKTNDTLQSIATDQLKDVSRVNEILQINGVGPYVVGSTLYLPPPTITKSSGKLKQVYGRLMEKNATSWHLGLSNDPKGQGLLIPSFWFESIPNKDSYKTDDCLKIFFDEGYKVYSVSLQ